MQIVLGIFSAGFLGVIIYFAISRKSSRFLRMASLLALSLIAISLVVCGIILIRGPAASETDIPLPIFHDTPPAKAKKGNVVEILVFFVILAAISALIIYSTRKDRQIRAQAAKDAEKSKAFYHDAELGSLEMDALGAELKEDEDESFDIGLD